jgi:hypothetical protein
MRKFFSNDIKLDITSAGQTFKQSAELDKSVVVINRYTILSNREDLAYYRGTFKLEINKNEIAPEGYSAKKVMCWPSVNPDSRQKTIGNVEPGNGLINFEFTDTNDGLTTFSAYTVTLSVEGEREE